MHTTETAEPQPDTAAAIEFLKKWAPDGPWVLTAISLDKKSLPTQTFHASRENELYEWLQRYNGKLNIYFHVNPLRYDVTKKATREDVEAVCWLHVDVDPYAGEDLESEQARIRELIIKPLGDIPEPTVVVFSGGGYQAFWRLEEPIHIGGDLALAEDAKRYNIQIERTFKADNCHNIDRIMRLPGTINLPDEKKRKKGRKPALAQVVSWNEDAEYPLSAFTAAAPAAPNRSVALEPVVAPPAGRQIASVDDLPAAVPEWTRTLIITGEGPAHHPSRSEPLYAVCCELVRCGIDDQTIYAVITNPEWGISFSVLDKGADTDRYARRQIVRAREVAPPAFRCDKSGAIITTDFHNMELAIEHIGVTLRHDLFAERSTIDGLDGYGPYLDDPALDHLYLEVARRYFRPPQYLFFTLVKDLARARSFHPVRDYLAGITWDGEPRLDRWLVKYGGAEDTEYVRAVGALVLVAAVRRVRSPGAKYDEMLVLEGAQGNNKSSTLRLLAVRDEWFSDDLPLNCDSRRAVEAMGGRWIVEASELSGMRRAETEEVKSLLSRSVDRARLAYARLPVDVPRQCIVIGTTNSESYLNDATGNRRFWPVRVDKFDLVALERDREQLWAEAAHREASGVEIRLDKRLWGAAGAEQKARCVEDPWVERLDDVLGDVEGKLPVEDTWLIVGVEPGRRTQQMKRRLGEAIRKLGFERVQKRINGKVTRCYCRGDDSEQVFVLGDAGGKMSVRRGGGHATPF